MENLQLWVGIIGGIIGIGVTVVGAILSVKKFKRDSKKKQIVEDNLLFERISKYFDERFYSNREIAKNEKKLEMLSQQKLCAEQCGKVEGLAKRMTKREEFDEVQAYATDILLDSVERISKGVKTNGSIDKARKKIQKFYIKGVTR